LTAIARRAGIPLDLDDVARSFAGVPLLVDLKPTGFIACPCSPIITGA